MFGRTVMRREQRVIVSEHRTLRAIPFHILRLHCSYRDRNQMSDYEYVRRRTLHSHQGRESNVELTSSVILHLNSL